MPGNGALPGNRLICRISHGAMLAVDFHFPVKNVFSAADNVVLHPVLVEVGDICHPGFIRHAELHQFHSAPHTNKPRFIRGNYRYTGSFPIGAEGDLLCLASVLITSREKGQKVIESPDAEFFKSFRAFVPDTAHSGDRGIQREAVIIQHSGACRSCSAGQTAQEGRTCRSLRCRC